MKMSISISNLRLRAIIGVNDWERKVKQDVIINITIEYDAEKAIQTDNIQDAFDYKAVTKEIIREIENSEYHLLESLSAHILNIIKKKSADCKATVRAEKPGALRYCDSVGIEVFSD
jgi:FolB domain-containing protein